MEKKRNSKSNKEKNKDIEKKAASKSGEGSLEKKNPAGNGEKGTGLSKKEVPKEKAPATKKPAAKGKAPTKKEDRPAKVTIPGTPKKKADELPAQEQVLEQHMVHGVSLLGDLDIHLFREGRHYRLYDKLGSHLTEHNGQQGVYFAVWAPNAEEVAVMGDFNGWNKQSHKLAPRWDGSGIWEGFIVGIGQGTIYKYAIRSNEGRELEKGDPFAFRWEIPPNTASIVWDLSYDWKDAKWMKNREEKNGLNKPISVYEMHMGSWRRKMEEDNRSLTYKEMADELVPYLKEMGFTHVEFMPVMEHPFGGSWGYQLTGFFAPTSRFGSPQDFMHLIDELHKNEIGIFLDWVPSHFPDDPHGIFEFDGTHLFEHADPRQGFHPDWNSYIFNFGRSEVKSFLISSAMIWMDKYHADGLRVDAVASMLYLDYSRKEGEWVPNKYGSNENLEAIDFLKDLNEHVYQNFPSAQTIAEESTAWPNVSRPTYLGGLGFGMKWMMGWMHDTLDFFSKDPIYRGYHLDQISFSIMYAFTENFMLPLSHDEVVYGKGSLINKMPGDDWQKFANLRLLYSNMFTHPGAKLIFMGGEFAQWEEWNHDESLNWHLTEYDTHKGIQQVLKDLNYLYRNEKALYEHSFSQEGFEWIDYSDRQNVTTSFIRKGSNERDQLVVISNFTPTVKNNYKVGVPMAGKWVEAFNSDDKKYGGSGVMNNREIQTTDEMSHGRNQSLEVDLPPLATIVLKLG